MGKHDHSDAIVYLIRHGEKPPKGPDGQDEIGLSKFGEDRAHGLVQVFGKHSQYDLGLILAQHPKKDGQRARPYETIKPLAQSLGDHVELNTDIDRDDADEVAKTIRHYKGKGNILVCWEHKELDDIAKALGVQNATPYPDDRYDIIWTVEPPYTEINQITSEHIPDLDKDHANEP